MGQPAVREPEPVVEALRIDHEGILFPAAHGMAKVERILGISFWETGLRPPVQIDESPVLITRAHHDPDALPVPLFQELHTVRNVIDPRSPLRLAVEEHRILLQEVPLAIDE